jgi:mono/diheme cytochrome c family protein
VLVLLVLLVVGISATVGWRPVLGTHARPVTATKYQATPARMERGRYLVHNVVGCVECHTPVETKADIDVPTGPLGSGKVFLDQGGLRVVASNITADRDTGIGAWTDDEIARAVREGVGRDGRALFPIMPYQEFRHISDEDLASVIVYIRTLQPVRTSLPKTRLPFPLSRLINLAPEPITAPVPQPDMNDPAKLGEYLTYAGGCIGCHTPSDRGQPLAGMRFAGGQVFDTVASTNLTPDPSGISYYDQKLFLEVIRTGKVKARQLKVMPWWVFRGMTDSDLASIFAYLRTVPPVKHRVDNAEPATYCKLCRHQHGAGSQN